MYDSDASPFRDVVSFADFLSFLMRNSQEEMLAIGLNSTVKPFTLIIIDNSRKKHSRAKGASIAYRVDTEAFLL